MPDQNNMNCDDIKQRLKLFLDDLLAEEEYVAFVSHMNSCDKCRGYVRSVGSLSNQLWKLGKVRVPGDLSSTILYAVAHSEQESQAPQSVITKRHVTIALIVILITIAVLLGFKYFVKWQNPHGAQNPPVIITEAVQDQEPPSASEARLPLRQLETTAKAVGVSVKAPLFEDTSVVKEAAPQDKAKALKAIPLLHWHFSVSEKSNEAELKKEMQQKEFELQGQLTKKELLQDAIILLEEKQHMALEKAYTAQGMRDARVAEIEKRDASIGKIENEMNLIELRIAQLTKENKTEEANRQGVLYAQLQKAYSEAIKDAKAAPAGGAESELEQKLKQKKELEASIETLEDQIRLLGLKLQLIPQEKQRRGAQLRQKLLDVLSTAGVRTDSQLRGHIFFSGTGKAVERVFEEILLVSGNASFRDFTGVPPTAPDKEYAVCVYIQEDEAAVPHWHIGPLTIEQKLSLLEAIREEAIAVDYKSEGLVIFSVSSTGLEKIRNRIQAKRIIFTEYGVMEPKKEVLSSGPITISLYFVLNKG